MWLRLFLDSFCLVTVKIRFFRILSGLDFVASSPFSLPLKNSLDELFALGGIRFLAWILPYEHCHIEHSDLLADKHNHPQWNREFFASLQMTF